MDSVCSCLCLNHSGASMHGHCGCFSGLAQYLSNVHTMFFAREQVHSIPLAVEERTSLDSSTQFEDTSSADTTRCAPRPFTYNDSAFSSVQNDGCVFRHNQYIAHSHRESEPLRGSKDDVDIEMSASEKYGGSNYEVMSQLCCPKSFLKSTSKVVPTAERYHSSSYEDEDECPTCLEDYTYENPRIVMECTHHFHLGCIYEWKERSELCPVCGKVMMFDES